MMSQFAINSTLTRLNREITINKDLPNPVKLTDMESAKICYFSDTFQTRVSKISQEYGTVKLNFDFVMRRSHLKSHSKNNYAWGLDAVQHFIEVINVAT